MNNPTRNNDRRLVNAQARAEAVREHPTNLPSPAEQEPLRGMRRRAYRPLEVRPLGAEDTIQPGDEWCPRDSDTWLGAWEEDLGLTVAQVEEKAAALGEPGAYSWRGAR